MSNNYPTRAGVEEAEALDFTERTISISTVVQHRGRAFTITFRGYTLDQAADLLDKRFGGTQAPPVEAQPLSTPPTCPVHRKPMKEMKYPSKQGHTYHCTVKMDQDTWCDERA